MFDPKLLSLAASGFGEIIGIVIFFLYGLFWFIRRLAESKEQQQRIAAMRKRQAEEQEQEEKNAYVADQAEVQRFLQSLGARPEPPPTPKPPAPHRPQPTRVPGRPPGHPAPQPARLSAREAAPEPPPVQAPPPPPPLPSSRPALVEPPRRAERTRIAERHAPAPPPERPAPGAPAMPKRDREIGAARAAAPTTHPLEFPQLTPAQRAIILSEIIPRRRGPRRPFSR